MIEFKRIDPADVDRPDPGGDVLFLDQNGVYYTMNPDGGMVVLGNGIRGIEKLGSVGLVDTYQITFDSGDTFDYTVTNGRSINSITKIGTVGLVDTYRIAYNDGPAFEYTVTNARSITSLTKVGTVGLISTYRVEFNDGPSFDFDIADGRGIANIEAPANAGQPNTTDTYTVRYNDGTTSTFIVRNGRDGIDGLVTSVNGISQPNIVLTADDVGAIAAAEKGAPNGVATLGADSKIPAAQLPAYVDDVLEFDSLAVFPTPGETGKIYVDLTDGKTYRWSGSQYIEISAAPVTQVNGKVGNVTLTTSDIAEGTNLYFTAQRVRDTILTGLSLATNAAITAADTVLSAFGKLQKQLSDHFEAVDPHPQYTNDAEATTIAQGVTNSALAAATADQAPGAIAANSALGTSTQFAREDHTHAGVTSFNGRQGVVTPQQADYDQFFTTPAEAAAAAPVQNFNGRTGNIAPQQADYDQFFTTPAEAAAAAPVQNFNGRTGNITPQQADYDAFFTTPAEAAAAAPVQSVNGQTGNVTVTAGTDNRAVTRTAPTASASTALTTIQSYPVAAGEITAGSEYEFYASLRVINTTTATNAVVTLSVGATNVLVLTQAIGTTAAAAPGAPTQIEGRITFLSATQAECVIHYARSQAVAANIILNTSAPITVSAAGATTIDLKFNTSGATSTFIARQASIQRVK